MKKREASLLLFFSDNFQKFLEKGGLTEAKSHYKI